MAQNKQLHHLIFLFVILISLPIVHTQRQFLNDITSFLKQHQPHQHHLDFSSDLFHNNNPEITCTEDCENGYFCCQDSYCCQNVTESCCPGLKDGPVCCEQETTYCCPAQSDYDLPSRCCPRWNVCCEKGSYGCCDPTTGLAVEDSLAYSLFVADGSRFVSATIGLPDGNKTEKTVNGYDDWSEITRVFVFNPNETVFYLPQANFLESTNSSRPINLYTVDPISATTTATLIGATQEGENDVPGFTYLLPSGLILLSTQFFNSTNVGYNFYHVNTTTGDAKLVSSYQNTTDTYVGWFTDASVDGNTVYRLGYYNVIEESGPGLGVTDISGPTATTQWYSDVPLPKGLGFYISLNPYSNGFISLAPDSSGDLWIVQWSIGGNATVLSKLTDAHNVPIFGPLVEYVNPSQTLYAALVVDDKTISDDDEWILVTYNLPNGPSTEIKITPKLDAKTSSASALGIPTL
eukprot:TRINITY_DN10164_c0_g1_i1.p1 TRINITY_DN10164_c0_g1~~TRINITY_DN10164_c0_g1_i1.p1  ORF type:complete len:463 (-),score=70.68 TRINITY_DN10164_c0_g1_i1:86-1474(-)